MASLRPTRPWNKKVLIGIKDKKFLAKRVKSSFFELYAFAKN
jgi:hypothetical protein